MQCLDNAIAAVTRHVKNVIKHVDVINPTNSHFSGFPRNALQPPELSATRSSWKWWNDFWGFSQRDLTFFLFFYDWSSEILSLWHHKGFWYHSKVSDPTAARCWLRPLRASKHVREPIKDQLEWEAQSSVPTAGCKQRAKYILLLAFFFYNRHRIILRCYFRTFGT